MTDHDRTDLHDHERVGRVLLVLATSGGGTGRHVADLARGLATPSRTARTDRNSLIADQSSADQGKLPADQGTPAADHAVGGDHERATVTVAGPAQTVGGLDLPGGVRRV